MTKSLSDAYWSDEPFVQEDDDFECASCGGSGFKPVDDPLWEDSDEFGEAPCKLCNGTGDRKPQTVF